MSRYTRAELAAITRDARRRGGQVRLTIEGFRPHLRSALPGLFAGRVIRTVDTAAQAARIEEEVAEHLQGDEYVVHIVALDRDDELE